MITGGAGFIGSALAERLCKDNSVIVLDDLTTGNNKNLEGLPVRFMFGHTTTIFDSIPQKVDIILHLGMASTMSLYLKDKILVAKELAGSIMVFEKAIKDGAKVVLASSSSLYNKGKLPSKEDQEIEVTDFYTECRLATERTAKLYSDLYGMDCTVLRMFSVYGGRREESKQAYANMITKFFWDMKDGKNPVAFGDGTQTRDLTYIDDVVDAWVLAAKYDKKKFDIFNVGSGARYDFHNIVRHINRALKTNLELKSEPNPYSNFVYHTWADTRKAKRLLGFKAKVSLNQGIQKIIKQYGKD